MSIVLYDGFKGLSDFANLFGVDCCECKKTLLRKFEEVENKKNGTT